MAQQLQGRTVAILAADGVERVEVEQPRKALDEAGAQTELLSLHDGEIQARNHDLEPAGTFSVDSDAHLLPEHPHRPAQRRRERRRRGGRQRRQPHHQPVT